MEYVIKGKAADTQRYVLVNGQGRMSIATTPEKATKFPDAAKAWKYISTQMPKKKRDGWTVVEFRPTRYEIDVEVINDLSKDFDWNDIGNRLSSLFGELYKYKDELASQIGNVEAELCDCEHACEFYNLSCEDGFRMYQMIHERRVRRRFLKNEYRTVTSILGMSYSDIAAGKIAEMLKEVNRQVYEPRAMRELFYGNSNM